MPVSAGYDTVGPLARSARDVGAAYEVIAGYDPLDPYSVRQPVESWASRHAAGLAGLRIGVPWGLFETAATPGVHALVQDAANTFTGLGATVHGMAVDGFAEAHAAFMICAQADAAAVHRERMDEAPERFGPDVARRLRAGGAITAVAYAAALAKKAVWKRSVEALFGSVDVIAMPTVGFPAPLATDAPDMIAATLRLTSFLLSVVLCRTAGTVRSLRPGRTVLPIGMQLVGPQWSEALLLACGVAFQDVTNHHKLRPPLLRTMNAAGSAIP